MSKARFLGTFLIGFAVLLVVWRVTPVASWYTDAMVTVGSVLGPLLHGWVLQPSTAPGGVPAWVRGADRVDLAIQLDSLAVGVVPLLALVAATPALGWRRRLALMGVGTAVNVLVDGVIVALFPLLVYYKNAFTDVIGTFLGIVAFVGAPVIIWFALTFRQLQRMLPSLRSQTGSAK